LWLDARFVTEQICCLETSRFIIALTYSGEGMGTHFVGFYWWPSKIQRNGYYFGGGRQVV